MSRSHLLTCLHSDCSALIRKGHGELILARDGRRSQDRAAYAKKMLGLVGVRTGLPDSTSSAVQGLCSLINLVACSLEWLHGHLFWCI